MDFATKTSTCPHCAEPVLDGEPIQATGDFEDGEYTPRVYHIECFTRITCGSVGDQLGLAAFLGKDTPKEDPPGLTVREAARMATRLANSGHYTHRTKDGLRYRLAGTRRITELADHDLREMCYALFERALSIFD